MNETKAEHLPMYAAIGCTSVGYAPGYLKNCSPDMVPNWGAWRLVECDEAINDLYVKSLATTDVDECNNWSRKRSAWSWRMPCPCLSATPSAT